MNDKALFPAFCACLFLLSGCSNYSPWFASSGPSSAQVVEQREAKSAIPVIDVTDEVARQVLAAQKFSAFGDVLSTKAAPGYVVGAGDVLEVSVWEAPPAALFGTVVFDPRLGPATTHVTALPEQMVAADGTINIPFVGAVSVAGKSPQQVEAEIVRRLTGKANQPQVLIRVTRNATANVTVIGEVGQSLRMPLSARGERLLDAIAAAGGVRQPVVKMTIQLSRGGQVLSMPLDAVIRDPKQNVILAPGDVVTALFQPLSFTVLGATGRNEEINYEAQGITLAQALGRIGGLQDARADSQGVFIFRFEDPSALGGEAKSLPHTPEGKVPVVYRVDMKDPRTFLIAQNFPVRDKDVLYVANAPSAELQKFLSILTSSIYSAASLVKLRP
ncbi:MAG: polysaccharide export protein [Proteobacteria bacterium]|nr:polysaccharide export protein [Pseudomonadota bacterium]HQR04684.1 polysaccharide biosynthesis/export family protein [Rhodocyclaceae bacterium]